MLQRIGTGVKAKFSKKNVCVLNLNESQISRESKVRSREHGPLEDVNPTYYSSSHTLKMIVRYEISDQEIYTASRIGFIIVS